MPEKKAGTTAKPAGKGGRAKIQATEDSQDGEMAHVMSTATGLFDDSQLGGDSQIEGDQVLVSGTQQESPLEDTQMVGSWSTSSGEIID